MRTAELRIVSGRHSGKSLRLPNGKFLVGRGEDCHLRPSHELISRHHCVFSTDEFGVRLRDLGSTNGTYVNDVRVQGTVVLEHGANIRIGKLEFIFQLREAVSGQESTGTLPMQEAADDSSATMAEMPVAEGPEEDLSSSRETVVLQQHETSFMPMGSLPPNPYGTPLPPGYPPGQYMVPGYPGQPYQQQYSPQGYASQYPPQPFPPQQYPPGYGAPQQYSYPPQQMPGYVNAPGFPGYPPSQGYPQAPGYPAPGYGPAGYPPPSQVPGSAALPTEVEAEIEEEVPVAAAPAAASKSAPMIRLPDPKDTGLKEAPPPPPAQASAPGAPKKETPSNKAADILKQMNNRRPV